MITLPACFCAGEHAHFSYIRIEATHLRDRIASVDFLMDMFRDLATQRI